MNKNNSYNLIPYSIKRFDFFYKNHSSKIEEILKVISEYKIIFNYKDFNNLTEDHYLRPIDKHRIKKCIFCHKIESEVSFCKKPHVIPYLLGNQFLLHYEECDECNIYFGKTLECELDKFLKPYRTLNRKKNRKGNLIRTDLSKKRSFKFNEIKNQFSIETNKYESFLDKDKNIFTIILNQEKYTPVIVYKAFMKIIFGLLPHEHLPKFEFLREFIINRDHSYLIFSPLNVIKFLIPGSLLNSLNIYLFHKDTSSLEDFKKNPVKESFDYLASIQFGNIVFDIPIFSDIMIKKMKVMKEAGINLEFLFPVIPKPGMPNKELLDLSKIEKVKNQEKLSFSYYGTIEEKIVNKKQWDCNI